MPAPKKLILKCTLSLGDLVMLTAAVRDLHRCHPKQFITDVRTPFPALWQHNPDITPLRENDRGVRVLECAYPLINRCDQVPYHCLHGFMEFLNDRLGLQIKPTAFKGSIHLSRRERWWYSQVHELTRRAIPFWIIDAGGKYDITLKWWDAARYQKVVDHFRGRIQFVQVGSLGHHHPPLRGVIDLRGKTDLRQLIRLVYHAQGVLCPVTGLMHLAAAVPLKEKRNNVSQGHRPCVVIAGGREPAHWEAYPGHQFLHTSGALACCLSRGCWKDRLFPLGDGDQRDAPENLCPNPVGTLPRCMDLITADEVIRRIELYFHGGALHYLAPPEQTAARRGVRATARNDFDEQPLNQHNARLACDRFLASQAKPAPRWRGRGIVICGGGVKYFTSAWVCINRLRALGCSLPIQLWHLGPQEMDAAMKALLAPLGVECVDAFRVRLKHPIRRLGGWELKPYAVAHSPFQEVLLLDADNVPVVNPEFLFQTAPYRRTGAVFWPDYGRLGPDKAIWRLCGVAYRDEPEFESGQMVMDKQRCWRSLQLTLWFNAHSDFFYRHVLGDKETFHLAWRKVEQEYAMVPHPIHRLPYTMCQHDFAGRRIFQHRNLAKWRLDRPNPNIPDFWHETECLAHLDDLRRRWNGQSRVLGNSHPKGSRCAR